MGKTYLMMGVSRGIGLEFVRQVLAAEAGSKVLAGVRNPAGATELSAMLAEEANKGRLELVQIDITSEESVKAAVRVVEQSPLAKDGIDVLLNNAGVLNGPTSDALTPSILTELQANFAANLLGPILCVQAFLPLLKAAKTKAIWFTGSDVGSFTDRFAPVAFCASYSISKAAMHMYALKLANKLREEQFTVLVFHPGWVRTDMGGENGEVSTEESVRGAIATLSTKGPADSGTFWKYTGAAMTW